MLYSPIMFSCFVTIACVYYVEQVVPRQLHLKMQTLPIYVVYLTNLNLLRPWIELYIW